MGLRVRVRVRVRLYLAHAFEAAIVEDDNLAVFSEPDIELDQIQLGLGL